MDSIWLLKKTDLSFTLNGEKVYMNDSKATDEEAGWKFSVVMWLSGGTGKFYVKAFGDVRYRYCEKVDLSYTASRDSFWILNAGSELYTNGYSIEGTSLTLRKTIEGGTGESLTVSEPMRLFECLESFDVSENNGETNCGYFETS